MFLLVLAALGTLGYALTQERGGSAASSPPPPSGGPPSSRARVGHAIPLGYSGESPLDVAWQYIRLRLPVPPPVAARACEYAAQIGRPDVADALARAYVAPATYAPPPATSPTPVPAAIPPAAPPPPPGAGMGAPPPQGMATAAPPPPPIQISQALSPIPGIPDAAWGALTDRLRRGDPMFASKKRVGQYHQSRTRLAELGFDPESLVGQSDVQESALAADLVEALSRAQRSERIAAALGQPVEVPDMLERPIVTLSGLLGLLSVGGTSGAEGWLGSMSDRRRFPFTTNLFLQTNGIF